MNGNVWQGAEFASAIDRPRPRAQDLRRLPATNEFPSGSKQSFDKPCLVLEILPDRGLRPFFGITPGAPGELRELFLFIQE